MFGAGGMLLAFMLLPVIALVATLSWSQFVAGLSHASVLPALKLTLQTTFTSLAVIVVLGTPLAWLLSKGRGKVARLVETLVRLPVVLPPAVAGVALLLAFGMQGLLGSTLAALGVTVSFTTTAVILAEIFVAAPFYVQAATSAFRNIDPSLVVVARTLGASPARVFFRIVIPLALPTLISGAAMSWARALGEFGATLMFAGNFPGETQTLTLAVYGAFESGDLHVAQAISLVIVIVAFTLLYALTATASRKHGGAL